MLKSYTNLKYKWPTIKINIFACFSYFILARLGFTLQFSETLTSPVWPPSGLSIALLLAYGFCCIPGIFLGTFLSNFFAAYLKFYPNWNLFPANVEVFHDNYNLLLSSLGIAFGNVFESILAVFLITKFISMNKLFNEPINILKFTLIAILCSLSSSIYGSITLYLLNIDADQIINSFVFWCVSVFSGIIIYCPFIFLIITSWQKGINYFYSYWKKSILFSIPILFLSIFVFTNLTSITIFNFQEYLIIPILLIFSFLTPIQASTLQIVIISIIASIGTVGGTGPFIYAGADNSITLFLLQTFMTILYLTVFLIQSTINKIKILEESKTELMKTRLSSLNLQMNPHFLFNAINGLVEDINTDPKNAEKIAITIANLLRKTLLASQLEMHPFMDELSICKSYIEIEKERFPKLRVNWDTEDEFSCNVPTLFLQPIIENAIKYGTKDSIKIKALNINKELNIEVTNKIADDSLSNTKAGVGIALNNLHLRLELIYDRSGLIQIDKNHESFKVNIRIPFI